MSAFNTPTGKGAGTVSARDAEFMFRVVQNMEGKPVVSPRCFRSRMFFKYFDSSTAYLHFILWLLRSLIPGHIIDSDLLLPALFIHIMIHSLADSATRSGELGEGGCCLEL
jgi:hypothetical protein